MVNAFSSGCATRAWLPGQDSNLEIRLQRPLCYQLHYRAVPTASPPFLPLRNPTHLRPHPRTKLRAELPRRLLGLRPLRE